MAYQSKYTGLQIDDLLDSVGGKQNEIEDLDSIRAGAAKGATALQSYTEKYTGTVTGIKINGVVKSGSGVIDLGTISTDISGKVDKVAGKQLSTEDFTTALKTKLEGLNNYDDTELSNAVETLRGDFDSIVSGDTTTAIKTFNEVIAFLDGLTDTQDLESIIASIEQQIVGKMDKVTLATVATSGSYNDLSNKPTIPTKTSELENDSNYIYVEDEYAYINGTVGANSLETNNITLSGVIDIAGLPGEVEFVSQFPIGSATIKWNGDGTKYLADDGTYKTVSGGSGTITGVSANGTSVATSGVANIPAASTSKYGVTKLSSATNSTSTSLAATASAVKAAYDLANGKQAKLVSGTNIKTINGTSILGSGNIEISGGSKTYVFDWGEGDVYSGTISAEEFAEMLDADTIIVDKFNGLLRQEADTILKVGISSCEFIIHYYTNGIASGYYFKFENNGSAGISWTTTQYESVMPTKTSQLTNDSNFVQSSNLKTINGESLIGSGDIIISGGDSSGGGSGVYAEVNHGTSDTTFTLAPNTFHVWDEVGELTLTLGNETAGVANEFLFQFISGSEPTALTLPDDIKWVNDSVPTIEPNMIYQMSILKGLAVCLEFSNAATLITNVGTYNEGSMMSGATLTFQYPVASDLTIDFQ